jgi:lysophospholipase L1-like esterase
MLKFSLLLIVFAAAHATPYTPDSRTRAGSRAAAQNVLWLPLGDSITFGCTGPTIQDCHEDCAGYRIPLALALSQPALGNAGNTGFNVTTMGTDSTGPSTVPPQWLRHCGFPGWTIPEIAGFLPKAFASSPTLPDLITIHLGTNDCNGGHTPSQMVSDMHTLLNHTFQTSPRSHVFLADTIATGMSFNPCIIAWNAQVPTIVSAWVSQGMVITFVPMYNETRICGNSGDDYDLCGAHQVHPTSAGYPRMASAFALSIMKHFNRTS